MRAFLLLLALIASTSSAAYKLSVGVAPAIVVGDVDPLIAPWAGRAVAEMLSWEISMVQTIRVQDPASIEKSLTSWDTRTEIGSSELDDARAAGQKLDVEAVLLPRLEKRGFEATLQLAVVVRKNLKDRVVNLEIKGPDDAILGLLRAQVVNTMDSLGIPVPPAVRQAATNRFKTKWDAIMEYGRALKSLSEGNKDEGLRHMRETMRLDPNIPAALVRTRTLERDLAR